MQQTVGAGKNFHERSEVHDLPDGTHVNLTDFGFLGQVADHLHGLLRGRLIGRRDQNRSVIFNVDRYASGLDDASDRLTARSDDLAHFILVDLQCHNSRRISGGFYAWATQDALHLLQDMDAALPRLFQSTRHDVAGHTSDLDVHLDSRDALLGSRDLEVHVAQMILDTEDVRQNGDLLPFRDQPHRDACNRRLDGNPRVHQGKCAAAHRRHG